MPLLASDPDRKAVRCGEAADQRLAVRALNSWKPPPSTTRRDHLAHVVRAAGVWRDEGEQIGRVVSAGSRVGLSLPGR